MAREGATARRSSRLEQGAGRVAGRRRQRRQQRSADALRTRPVVVEKRRSCGNRAAAGDRKDAGRSAGVLLPGRRGGTARSFRRRAGARCSITVRSKATIPTIVVGQRCSGGLEICRSSSGSPVTAWPGTSARSRRMAPTCRSSSGWHRRNSWRDPPRRRSRRFRRRSKRIRSNRDALALARRMKLP